MVVKLSLHVINKDPNNNLRYWIDDDGSQKFEVNEGTGDVTVKAKLDREVCIIYASFIMHKLVWACIVMHKYFKSCM